MRKKSKLLSGLKFYVIRTRKAWCLPPFNRVSRVGFHLSKYIERSSSPCSRPMASSQSIDSIKYRGGKRKVHWSRSSTIFWNCTRIGIRMRCNSGCLESRWGLKRKRASATKETFGSYCSDVEQVRRKRILRQRRAGIIWRKDHNSLTCGFFRSEHTEQRYVLSVAENTFHLQF